MSKNNDKPHGSRKNPVAPAWMPPPDNSTPPAPFSHVPAYPVSYQAPLYVPEPLSPNLAKDFFDRGDRIFISPSFYLMTPESQNDLLRMRHSYALNNWWQYIMPQPEYDAHWTNARLHRVWDRIIKHAENQLGGAYKKTPKNLSFYHFTVPEIHDIYVPGVCTEAPYRLVFSSATRTYIYLYLTPTPTGVMGY